MKQTRKRKISEVKYKKYSKNIPAHWTTIRLMEASLITNWEEQVELLK